MSCSGGRIIWILTLIPRGWRCLTQGFTGRHSTTTILPAQIDFNFLNNTYQAYNGGAPYFNPGLNVLFKIGTLDLFEDYRITGGFQVCRQL